MGILLFCTNFPFVCLFVVTYTNLHCHKEHLETLHTCWWWPRTWFYRSSLWLPALQKKIVQQFLIPGSMTPLWFYMLSNSCEGLNRFWLPRNAPDHWGSPGCVLRGTACNDLPCGRCHYAFLGGGLGGHFGTHHRMQYIVGLAAWFAQVNTWHSFIPSRRIQPTYT